MEEKIKSSEEEYQKRKSYIEDVKQIAQREYQEQKLLLEMKYQNAEDLLEARFLEKKKNLQEEEERIIFETDSVKQELEKLQEDYFVFSNNKIANNEYDNSTLTIYNELLKQNFYDNGIINCPYIENENIVDYLTLMPKVPTEIA